MHLAASIAVARGDHGNTQVRSGRNAPENVHFLQVLSASGSLLPMKVNRRIGCRGGTNAKKILPWRGTFSPGISWLYHQNYKKNKFTQWFHAASS
jgi:hypothetical protein